MEAAAVSEGTAAAEDPMKNGSAQTANGNGTAAADRVIVMLDRAAFDALRQALDDAEVFL